jgi:hypothetical protein
MAKGKNIRICYNSMFQERQLTLFVPPDMATHSLKRKWILLTKT